MRPVTSRQMYETDKRAVEELKVPEMVLMENAGRGISDAVVEYFGVPKKAVVVCGRGNNGGDGAVAARHLKISGAEVKLFVIGAVSASKGSAKQNFEIASNCDIPVIEIFEDKGTGELETALHECDLVIDAIFGIGLKDDVEGLYAAVIDRINSLKSAGKSMNSYRVVSADIPSGLDSDTGDIRGKAVNADMTVTFHFPKTGLLTSSGALKSGKMIVANIGIPCDAEKPPAEKDAYTGGELADAGFITRNLGFRRHDSNKGDNGRVVIIAGSSDMAGAAVLCSRSALRTGSGLVNVIVPGSIRHQLNSAVPEAIVHAGTNLAGIKKMKPDVVAIGPGLGIKKKSLVQSIIKADIPVPLIIDADALNSIASSPGILKKRKYPTVITPHPGEMARLLKTTSAKVQSDRINISLKFAKDYNVIVVLKGSGTVIASPGGRYYVNTTGNPGMASAGMGDVLTGMLTSLIGQGVSPFEASVCAVFLHGLAGDAGASIKGERGLTATDIIEAIPYTMKAAEK